MLSNVWSHFRTGVSNSNQYEGRIMTKKELAGRITTKKCLRGPQKRVKSALTSQIPTLSAIKLELLVMTRAAQTHQAGRVFETPDIESP